MPQRNKDKIVILAVMGACLLVVLLGFVKIGSDIVKRSKVEKTTAENNIIIEQGSELITDNTSVTEYTQVSATEESSTEEITTEAKQSLLERITGSKKEETTVKTTVPATSKIADSTTRAAETLSTTVAATIASTTTTTTKKAETTTAAATTVKPASNYEYAKYGFNPTPVRESALTGDGYLTVIINRDYCIPDGYVPKLAPSITNDPDSYKLDYRVAPHYNEMYLAAKKDGITLTPISGYRSYQKQKNNFENKIGRVMSAQGIKYDEAVVVASKTVLPPGLSEHNAGLAMDICSLEQSFDQSREYKWLEKHAAEYGFILRYPKDKVNVTKIIYEPWHYRYVGVELAQKIKASGLCMEEYFSGYNAG